MGMSSDGVASIGRTMPKLRRWRVKTDNGMR